MISGQPELLKRINTANLLNILRREGPLSRAELAKRLNVSKPTVSKLVSDLLKNQTLVEAGYGPSNGGKRPIYLQINSNAAYVLGLHITYPTIKMVLANNSGAFLSRCSYQATDSLELLVASIVSHTEQLLAASSIQKKDLSAIGIAFSGIVDPHSGEVIYARYFPSIKGNSFRQMIEERLGAPVCIDNDVYMGVLGEAQRLEHKPHSILFVTIGALIGLSMMIEGTVYRGARFAASEMGDMITDSSIQLAEGIRPERGYLEKQLQAIGHAPIIQAAKDGEPVAMKQVEADQHMLACALSNVISIFDPEQIIVGGSILHDQELFLPQVERLLQKLTNSPVVLKPALYKDDSELAGSVYRAIQNLYSNIRIMQV